MNTTLDQDLSADHHARMTAGLRDYDDQWIERERMANELQQRFESSRQRKEEQNARLLDTAYQAEHRLLHTIESTPMSDDRMADISHAAVTLARLRSLLTELTR
jgi:hypothetical protein